MALDPNNGFIAADGAVELGSGAGPIFKVAPVELEFSIAADFVAAQVANDVLILALSNGKILRIDLNRPQDIDGKCRSPNERPMLTICRYRSTQETL